MKLIVKKCKGLFFIINDKFLQHHRQDSLRKIILSNYWYKYGFLSY